MYNTIMRRAGIAAALSLPLAAGASAETRRITLLGSSDIHGYFVPWDYATDTEYKAGALSKIATVVKRIRAEGVFRTVFLYKFGVNPCDIRFRAAERRSVAQRFCGTA